MQEKNYIRIAYFTGQPSSLDPFHGFDPDSYTLITACHDSLTYIGKDGEIKPLLATSWKRLSPTCFSFILREGVKFHNLEDFNAEAVVLTLQAQINPENKSPTGLGILSSIKEVEKVSEYEVNIYTHFPDSMLPYRMAIFSAIVPPQLLKEKGVDYFKDKPVGTGPFIFESMQKGKEIVLRANENYWGGKPKVFGLRFLCLPSQYWTEGIKQEKVDLMYGVQDLQIPLLRTEKNLYIQSQLSTFSHWFLLASKGPLLDKRVRLAMNLAIDNTMIARFHSHGNSIPQRSIATEGQFGYNPYLQIYQYDPEKALELLKEAGFEEGFTLKGIVADHSASLVQMIAAYLEDINITLEYEIIPRTEWMERVPNARMRGEGIYPGDFAVAPIDNPIMYSGFHHYIFLSKEGPFSLVEDDIYQQLFLESMTAENEVVSEMKLQDLDWYVHEEAMLLFTIQSEVHVVLANGVEMDISKNGHFGTYSWLSLQDNREEKEYPEWDFEYLNENKDVEYEEFQKVFKASEHANMFWFTGEALQDKRLDKLVSNLKYLEYLKQTQEKFRFIQIVHFLQKVKDMEALMEASRFSGIATYNIKGEPLLFNHTFLNLLGKSAKVKKIHELFTSLESWKNFEEKLREEEGFLGSIDLVKDDSNILPAQVACSLRLDDTGRSVGYLLIIRDESHERRLQRELELSYLDLEKKVIERTKELKETLDQVEALKKIQDGDYFLTSLLITPLGQNVIQSPYVQVESFLKQKKSFLFKEKYYEIGGDINIAHKLTLKNRSHILFMNADAMGKSIQGAGGVLVLGSVFQSIIERTKMNPSELNHYPERWLKIVIKELNGVFLSFNGSMLISLVVGLIDEESGLMYYVNIEHPELILYRDKKASFLKYNSFIRKLGTTDLPDIIHIDTFNLSEGDIILMGSDGKDDVVVGEAEDGSRIINENEEAFLLKIEDAGADLSKIYQYIGFWGEITDDFSLLKITYTAYNKPNVSSKLDLKGLVKEVNQYLLEQKYDLVISKLEKTYFETSNKKVFKWFIELLIQKEDYEKASNYLEAYIYAHPEDTAAIFANSYCLRKIKKYEKAIDFGERIRLRGSKEIENTINLLKSYIKAGKTERVKYIGTQLLKISIEDDRLKRWKAYLEKNIRESI